ncbi:MAG TPA: hypothetical protein VNW50_17300 [Streptosporangiaceae bacterium]|nr:hypothetical protein [Streptosporangiaceae bacterium]
MTKRQPSTIVTTHYRYKPPPRKRKAAPLAGPAVVTPKRKPAVANKPEPAAVIACKAKPCNDNCPEPEHLPDAGKKPAIVTARKPGKRYAVAPDMTPGEHQRRGEAAGALWRGLVGQATAKDGESVAASAESSSPATKPAIVVTSRKRRRSDGPSLPMELPLSRKPVVRDGGDYKRMKAAMTRRIRGETN